MKFLHISNKPVYPAIDGGSVAMASLLTSLREIGNVSHLCLSTQKHPYAPAAYPSTIHFPLDPEKLTINTTVRVTGAVAAWLGKKNYNLARFYDPDCAAVLTAHVAGSAYDYIVFESIFSAVYLNDLRKVCSAKMIIRTHNVEHELWEQQASNAKGLKRSYLQSLAKSLRREELQLLNNADAVWTITQEDQQRFEALGVETPIFEIPVAVAIRTTPPSYSPDFFLLGAMNWEPNKQAVRYLTQLWPTVHARHPESRLHIAGSFSEAITVPRDARIFLHGKVDDAALFMGSHGTLAAPVFSGSGIRIKLLEAMAAGIPCITTSLGAAGIRAHEAGVALADNTTAWITCLEQFAQSESQRRECGAKAIAYMEKYHSFAAVNAQIRTALGG